LSIATAVLGARIATHLLRPQFTFVTHFFPTHLRLDSLQFGVLLGYWSQFHSERFWSALKKFRAVLLPTSLILISPCVIFGQTGDIPTPPNPFLYTFGFTSIYLGFGLLMVLFLQIPVTRERRSGLWGPVSGRDWQVFVLHLFVAFPIDLAAPEIRDYEITNRAAGVLRGLHSSWDYACEIN
jgi:hypothetical protein